MTRSKRTIPRINVPPTGALRELGLKRSIEARANGPKCGAKSRTTGEPCRQPVKEEGKRCRYHGGATPKGKNWHRRQWPKGGVSPRRAKGKLRALDRRDREAEERRAAMTPEERELHEERRKAQRPGTPAERQAAARQRRMARELRDLLSERAESPEQTDLKRRIAQLEAEVARRAKADDET